MLLVAHLIIALTSIVIATWAVISPSRLKLRANYALVGATLASGTWLVVSTHSPLLSSCLSGLIYLSIVTAGLVISARKLARETVRTGK
jgi:hypothetical protein